MFPFRVCVSAGGLFPMNFGMLHKGGCTQIFVFCPTNRTAEYTLAAHVFLFSLGFLEYSIPGIGGRVNHVLTSNGWGFCSFRIWSILVYTVYEVDI